MSYISEVLVDLYSIVVLLIICINILKFNGKEYLRHKIFIKMLAYTITLLVFNTFMLTNGRTDSLSIAVNAVGTFLFYLVAPILPCLWLSFIHLIAFSDTSITKKLNKPLGIIISVNAVLTILSLFFGLYYYIDENNIYHAGPLLAIFAGITIVLVVVSVIITIFNHDKFEKLDRFVIFFSCIPIITFVIVDPLIKGSSLTINGSALVLLLLFLNRQNRNIYIDYLTGISNRKKLDEYLDNKIDSSTLEKSFSAILIDIDNFKFINDSWGHKEGDVALEITTKLLKTSLRSNDFIARYGGDEFFIVLDISDLAILEATVERIKNTFRKYNESNIRPYKLEISMGYAIYDCQSNFDSKTFQNQVDMLMYKNKQAIKAEGTHKN